MGVCGTCATFGDYRNGTDGKPDMVPLQLHPPLGKALPHVRPSRSTYRAPVAMWFRIELAMSSSSILRYHSLGSKWEAITDALRLSCASMTSKRLTAFWVASAWFATSLRILASAFACALRQECTMKRWYMSAQGPSKGCQHAGNLTQAPILTYPSDRRNSRILLSIS